jgi:deoxyribose-phosphate aldolase
VIGDRLIEKMKNGLEIAGLIDHTLLRADASEDEIEMLCEEAITYGFFSVCVNPSFVGKTVEVLSGTGVKVSTVIGFPLGTSLKQVKVYEAIESVINGSDELDIVINPGLAKAHKWEAVEKEISLVIAATPGVTHKIIIETAYLTDDEKIRASLAVMNAGGEFVKTSTGFAPSGAVVKDVELIRSATKGAVGIKASGSIHCLKDVKAFINAGATRIGTSSGVRIMEEIGREKIKD